ncbi:MAG TPA: hypothetical protein VIV54_09720 [Burkholderiales bacterium]
MFLGHFAAGFGAKAAAPKTSLGSLFLAAQFIDLLWPTLLLLGAEQVRIDPAATKVVPLDFEHYPISHSLAAVIGWALAVALLYQAIRRYPRGAVVLGALVLSHWALDLVVHRPDLALYPGGPKVGFGLWSSLPATLAVECALFAVGVWLYARTTRPNDRTGQWALWSLVVVLLAIYAANLFGPPPESTTAIAWVGHAQWLLVLWGYWIDRHRTA